MKLRIDPKRISFRIDFDELEKLLKAGEVHETTALPKGVLCYRVICSPAGTPPDFQADFQADNGAYILSLPKDVLEAHKAELPSLNGIVTEFDGGVKVSLEVNLKKKLKRSLKQ